jgi:chromosome segregation ATPase
VTVAGEEKRQAPRRRSVLPLLLAVGLGVAVAWLLAERNARQWWIVQEDGKVVVKKGIFFVTGKTPLQSADPETARTYAPIPAPQGGAAQLEAAYDDRAELDQALFELLARWARADIQSQQMERMERARGYLGRAARLAGLSPAQREQLRVLQAETAFQEAVEHLTQGANALRRALEGLRLAAEARGPVAAEAAALEKSLEPVAGSTGQLMLEASRFAAERYRAAPPAPGAPSPTGAPAR